MSCWMTAEGVEVAQLTPAMVERFLEERGRTGQAVMISARGSRPLIGYLAGLGVLPPEDRAPSSAQVLLEDLRAFLLGDRGLQVNTAVNYENAARVFLAERPEPLGEVLERLTAAEITGFVLDRSRRGSVATASKRDLGAAGPARVPARAGRYPELVGPSCAVCRQAREPAPAGA